MARQLLKKWEVFARLIPNAFEVIAKIIKIGNA
jgi:hypothetical protein